MVAWVQANWQGIVIVFAGVIRVVESIMVLTKNQKGINFINIVKEFFKLS